MKVITVVFDTELFVAQMKVSMLRALELEEGTGSTTGGPTTGRTTQATPIIR